jgi:hypothetical protein
VERGDLQASTFSGATVSLTCREKEESTGGLLRSVAIVAGCGILARDGS